MFGEVISLVEFSFFPIDDELSLPDTVADPIESHVDSFGSLLFDSLIGNARSSIVVCEHWSWWLWMAEFGQCDAERTGFFAIVKEGTELGFSSTGEDFLHDLGEDKDGAIHHWRWISRLWGFCRIEWHVAEIVISRASGTGFGF